MRTPGGNRLRILVVDDDPLVCDSLKWLLGEDGCEVTIALTGQAGLSQFRTGSFDVVILDYRMPDLDGDQVAVAIRTMAPKQPILMMTAYPEAMAGLGKRLGSADFLLPKPFKQGEIRDALARLFSKRGTLISAALARGGSPPETSMRPGLF